MSTSAADYYRVLFRKRSERAAREEFAEAEDALGDAQDALAYAREEAARCKERLTECKNKVAISSLLTNDANEEVEEASKRRRTGDVLDPRTGIKRGEEIKIAPGDNQMEYLTAMANARELMAEGRLQEAIDAEKIATVLGSDMEYAINSKALFFPIKDNDQTVQVSEGDLVEPRELPENDESIDKTLAYALKIYEEGIMDDHVKLMGLLLPPIFAQRKGKLPDGVNPILLMKVMDQIREVRQCHKDMKTETPGEDGSEAGDEDDGENGRSSGNDFEMDSEIFDSIEEAIRNHISKRREANAEQLEPPTPESSNMARYNTDVHFKFSSESANTQVDYMTDSLLNCKLRSVPTSWIEGNNNRGRIPFQYRSYDNSGFDIDGDLIALCGDKIHDNIRESKNYVGFQDVPCPVNLESSKTLCDLRDCNDSNKPWDTGAVVTLHEGRDRSKHWFQDCIADSENNLVWASCCSTGEVHAFSTKNSDSGTVARLSFPEIEVKLGRRLSLNPHYGLVKCENVLVGGYTTGRLCTWNIDAVIKNSNGPEKGRVEPHIMVVEESKSFGCGDLQYIGDARLVVAPFPELSHSRSSTVRLYDVQAEKVTGLFCGPRGDVSIGKQYCADSHNCVFMMSDSVGAVFDLRSYQPVIALQTESCEQIVGVPTDSSSPVAFTYGSNESIKCWDLRMPGSHAYAMSTGNCEVQSLLWHEGTSSLIANTKSKHIFKYNRYSTTMYGEDFGEEKEDEMHCTGYWPPRAVHERDYFGSKWHCNSQYAFMMLQYPFQNGRGMHGKAGAEVS